MMISILNKNSGTTLVEFVLYIGLTAILVTVIGAAGLNAISARSKVTAMQEINQNAVFVMSRIQQSTRRARAINSPSPGSNSSFMSLKMDDSSENPTVFDLSESHVRVKKGSGDFVLLTSDEVRVSDFTLKNMSYSGTPGTVRIELSLKYSSDSDTIYPDTETFYTTVNIRDDE